ncbi:hypothetical protein AB0G05_26810 [Nonomuraea wenchangensis]
MTRRLTPRRLAFLRTIAEQESVVLYPSWPDIPGFGLNQNDVDALVELDLIHIDDQNTGHHGEARKTTLTDAGRAALDQAKGTNP